MVFTKYTYQDWLDSGMDLLEPERRGETLLHIISTYKTSDSFMMALEANQYFAGASPVIGKKTMLRGRVISV